MPRLLSHHEPMNRLAGSTGGGGACLTTPVSVKSVFNSGRIGTVTGRLQRTSQEIVAMRQYLYFVFCVSFHLPAFLMSSNFTILLFNIFSLCLLSVLALSLSWSAVWDAAMCPFPTLKHLSALGSNHPFARPIYRWHWDLSQHRKKISCIFCCFTATLSWVLLKQDYIYMQYLIQYNVKISFFCLF